jgi:hypothetical protein
MSKGVIVVAVTEGWIDNIFVVKNADTALGFSDGFSAGAGSYGGGSWSIFIEGDLDGMMEDMLICSPDEEDIKLIADVKARIAAKRKKINGLED